MDINKFSPKQKLKVSNFVSMDNFDEFDIYEILSLARKIKMSGKVKEKFFPFSDKTIAFLIGSENSRMRIPFELSVSQLGGHTLYLSPKDIAFKEGMPYTDAINILKAYGVSGMVIKEENENLLSELFSKSPIPLINVYNSENDLCNILANLLTIWEEKKALKGINLSFLGDSKYLKPETIKGYTKCGINVTIASPFNYTLDEEKIENASQYTDIVVSDDISKAVKDADFLSNIFFSEDLLGEKNELLKNYTVSEKIISLAKPDAKFLSNSNIRIKNIENDFLYGNASLVLKQAENLIYIQKALMLLLFR